MKQIKTTACKSGDILAEDVFNCNGVNLAMKDTIINEYIKVKLIDFGINEIKIYDSIENSDKFTQLEKNYTEAILKVKELLREVALGNNDNIKNVASFLSKQIYKNISESDNIIQYLQRIRNIDEYTYTHCINVAFYSMLIGVWINLKKNEIEELICASLLHDIGKTKIPSLVLNKKGKLDANEYEIIKNHSVLGYEIIKEIPDFSLHVKKAILLHHERIDGSGYPFGLKGDAICLYAKIISIADVYDAMTQNRIYKNKVSPFESFQMFLTEGVRLYDYSILYEFLRHLAPLYVGSNVQLSNGEIGKIVYIPPQDIVYPILSINSEYVDLSTITGIKVLEVV
ncbi:MAG: HD-GYP domain-containing protein [Herbinix sp.]|nr:HD-GYP domain-containing protein [Herbinix sp.]